MNLPRLSDERLLELADQEDAYPVFAINPKRLKRQTVIEETATTPKAPASVQPHEADDPERASLASAK